MSAILVINDKEVRDHLEQSPLKFRKGCMQGFRFAGRHVKARIKKLIKDPPKTGRKYRSLPNRSSRDGEAPANQYGVLLRGVRFKVWRYDLMEVGDTAKHGGFLEDGTKFMKPRSHISPAVSQTYKTVLLMLQMAVRQELEKK